MRANLKESTWVWAVIIGGNVLLAYAIGQSYKTYAGPLLVFVALIAVGDLLDIQLPSGGHISQGAIAFLAAILLFGWKHAVAVAYVGVIVAALITKQRTALFNASQLVVVGSVTGMTFELMGGKTSNLPVPHGLAAALVAWAVYFVVNLFLVARLMSYKQNESLVSVARAMLRFTLPVAPLQGVMGITLAILFVLSGAIPALLLASVVILAYVALTANFFKAKNEELKVQHADSQVYLDDLMASMMTAVVGIDTSNHVNIFNHGAEQIFGCSAASVLGQDVAEISEVELPALLIKCLKSGRSLTDEELSLHMADRVIDVLCNVTIMRNSRGATTGSVAVLQDVTERKRMEQRLNHLDRLSLLGEFAAGIVHEINNPLMLIHMAVDNVEHEVGLRGMTDEVEQLRMASRNLNRLEKLAQQLLSFSRPRPSEPRPVDVGEVLSDVLNLASVQARVARVRVEREVSQGIMLLAETAPLQQVFLNLIVNAIQAMPSGGLLQVALGQRRTSVKNIVSGLSESPLWPRLVRDLRPVGALEDMPREFVWISFSDTGTGIPGDVLERLGQTFVTTKETGTGLGMAMVSKILSQYQGLLELASEPGEGTIVTVWLPKLSAEALMPLEHGTILAADARLTFTLTPPDGERVAASEQAAASRE